MYRISLKNTTLISGDKHGSKFIWKIILSFILVVSFLVTLNTGGRQYKQAVRWPWQLNRRDRLIEVKITVIKGRQIVDFDMTP